MLISIITVNLNDKEGLEKTILSVQKQSFTDFEHIIIDGGSNDGSVHSIEKYQDGISYWISEPDKGIYNAMNKGIKVSKGIYLIFLNSGDTFYSNNVLTLVAKHVKDADIIYGNLVKTSNNQNPVVDKGPNGSNVTLKTLFRGTINHPSSFIKRILFEEYGFYDEKLNIVSDWKFFLIVIGLNDARVKYIDIEISCFDMAGISNQNISLRKQERDKVLLDVLPSTIYKDYCSMQKIEKQNLLMNSNRFKMLSALEQSYVGRKLNSLILRVLLFLLKGKRLKDL